MLAPLYAIGTATVTVAAPGAAQNATSIPVAALTIALPSGYVLDFGTNKFARLTADAAIGAVSLAVSALPTALIAGDAASVPASPLLSSAFTKLPAATQSAQHLLAERLLGLVAPAYTGDDADDLGLAVVLQINYQLARGLTEASYLRQSANNKAGNTTTYRDRWIDPDAAQIVARVTGRSQVRFEPATFGV